MNWEPSRSQNIKRSSRAILLALATALAPVALSSPIQGTGRSFCACCADPGVWSLETREIADHEMKELNRLMLDSADFYATDAWPDGVSGVSAPENPFVQSGYFIVSIVREQQNWKLFFKTSKGDKGVLVLTMPGAATFFDADLEALPKSKRQNLGDPVLYKEVRLEGDVRGTGIFAKGMAPKTKYRLVLQGRGNWCMDAETFYRWNLRVHGPRAEYTVYGSFAKPSPRPSS
jgi:hypothetical protein